MPTAYEEGLQLLKQDIALATDAEDDSEYSNYRSNAYAGDYVPRYGISLEAHGDISGGGFFSELVDIAEGIPESVANAPKFVAASLVSGTAQLYNSGIELANWAGADLEHADVEDLLAKADDDLAAYYAENQEAVDLTGFIAGSIVPGAIGVKGLQMFQSSAMMTTALQSGKYGKGMQTALGILAPNRQKHLAAAIKDVVSTDNVFKLTNGNMLQSLRAGFGQSVLEVAAAETMTYAMMHQSPVLEGQDFGDFLSNTAITSVAFGAIGGAVRGASDFYAVKKVGQKAEFEAMAWTHKEAYPGVSASEDVSLALKQINEVPEVTDDVVTELSDDILSHLDDTIKGELKNTDVAVKRKEYLQQKALGKVNSLQNDIRSNLLDLAEGDTKQATAMFNSIFNEGEYASRVGKTVGLEEISGVNVPTKLEMRIEALEAKLKKGTASLAEAEEYENLNIGYQRNWGFDSGTAKMTDKRPIVTMLSDIVDEVDVDTRKWKVTAGDNKYQFSMEYDLLHSSPLEANARYMLAQKLPKFSEWKGKTPVILKDTDIPMLDKVAREYDTALAKGIKLRNADGDLIDLPSKEGYIDWLKQQKREVASLLQSASETGVYAKDANAVADRLRSIISSPFTVATPKSIKAHGLHEFIGAQLAASQKLANTAMDINASKAGFRRISINANDLTTKPMQDLVHTLKHEEGHDFFTAILQNGGIPKGLEGDIVKEMEGVSRIIREANWHTVDDLLKQQKAGKALTKGQQDFIDYMNDQHELAADTFSYFSQWYKQGKELAPTFEKAFGHKVNVIPDEIVAEYANRAGKLTEQEIAAMTNTTTDFLKGGVGATEDAMFAFQKYSKEYSQKLRDTGRLSQNADDIDILSVPQHSKLAYDSNKFKDMDDFTVQAMTHFQEQNKVYMQGLRVATDTVLGELADNLPENLLLDTRKANRFGAGSGFVSFANGNYGSLASAAEFMGRLTTQIKTKLKNATEEALQPSLYKLAQRPEAAIEFSVLNNKLRAIPEKYILDLDTGAFRHAGHARWEKEVAELSENVKLLDEQVRLADGDPKALEAAVKKLEKLESSPPAVATKDAPLEIPIKHSETLEAAKVHIELNAKRVTSYAMIRQAQGSGYNVDPEVFYPTPVNPKDYPYFAIAVDDTVTAGWGSHSTIYATSADELESMVAEVRRSDPKLKVHTAKDAEDYYKSIGQFNEEKTLTDNYFDISLKRKGVSASLTPATDPNKITDDLLSWHLNKESGLVNETMLARYEDKFEELRMLGETHTNFQTSKFSNVRKLKHLEDVVDNPFTDYIRTALGMSSNSKYPLWVNANRQLDEAVSKLGRAISSSVHRAKSSEELAVIGQAMEDAGYPGVRYTADMEMFANSEMPRGLLESFIRKANSLLSTVTLRLDSIQAVNNAVSSNILVGAEAKAVIRAIEAGDSHAVGKLTDIAKAKIPDSPYSVLSPSKLIANAYSRYFKSMDDPALKQFYKDNGFITSISDQYKWSLDQLSFSGKETAVQADGAIKSLHDNLRKAADTGEKWTGNLLAEEMNRFVSADVMKQLTDIAVDAGKMSKNEALSYINTFVSRTQGNYLAAQRPALFKGAIGQSIGLFQTYQFNLIQQLLRHVGDGTAKDAMTLLALQGSVHGMNGLPAFSAVNQHLIGTASGNTAHRDMYDAAYTVAGKEAGDWLLYGAGSNFLGLLHPDLKFNLYTRGDINPRHLTIIPNSVNSVPWVNAYGKFLGNFIETGKKLAKGGDPTATLLQGIEHNGLSRPMAGMAQSLEAMYNPRMLAYSTTKQGNVSASNDFFSLATAVRIAGAKPLDDAIALDTVYRLQAYGLRDSKKTQLLGEAFKSKVIGGSIPQREELLGFMRKYMEYGGNQENFSKWARSMYKAANLSQANKFAEDLDSWESQHMQKIMAGEVPDDFYSITPE